MGMAQYEKAIDNLLKGNTIYNSDTGLLNSLGFCFYKTSQKTRALNVLKASLRLNQKQENIKKLVEEIEKELNK
jgi:Tfp pilus assembly protein PilF